MLSSPHEKFIERFFSVNHFSTRKMSYIETEKEASFRLLFESAPGLYLVLLPDFTIYAVSDEYAEATMTNRAAIVGKHLFEVFPDTPDDTTADGVLNLRSSLNHVLKDKTAH